MDIFKTVNLSGDRHRTIFSAVLDLLDRDPTSPLTMAQIADQCGLAKGTLYLSFESKTALFTALREQMVVDMLEGPQLVLKEQSDPYKALDFLLCHCMTYPLQEQPAAFNVLFGQEIYLGENWVKVLQKLLQRQLLQGAEQGVFDVDDPLQVARLMTGGLVMTWRQLFRLDQAGQQNLVSLTSQSLQRLVPPLEKPQKSKGHKSLDVPSH